MSNPSLCFHPLQDADRIERVEEDEDAVRWKDLMLLAPGVWTDAGSGEPILYGEEGIENSAQNWTSDTVNFLHEREDELWRVGRVDTDTAHTDEEGRLFADIVLDTDKTAGQLADEALQRAMETGGREGVQGPSVELKGLEYEYNDTRGVKELVRGEFNGLALVGVGLSPGPASKTASFAHQTRERAVAMSQRLSDETACFRTLKYPPDGSNGVREQLRDNGIDVSDDLDDDVVARLAEALNLATDDEGEAQLGDREELAEQVAEDFPELSQDDVLSILDRFDALQDDEDDEDPEEDDEEGEGAMSDIQAGLSQLEEQLRGLADDVGEKLASLEEDQSELASADAIERLDQRLQRIESAKQEPKSLADNGEDTTPELSPDVTHTLGEPRVTVRSEP